jgi:hypothetical protein
MGAQAQPRTPMGTEGEYIIPLFVYILEYMAVAPQSYSFSVDNTRPLFSTYTTSFLMYLGRYIPRNVTGYLWYSYLPTLVEGKLYIAYTIVIGISFIRYYVLKKLNFKLG